MWSRKAVATFAREGTNRVVARAGDCVTVVVAKEALIDVKAVFPCPGQVRVDEVEMVHMATVAVTVAVEYAKWRTTAVELLASVVDTG